MARVCEICKKRPKAGGSIARRGLPKKSGGVGLRTTGHTKRTFTPNIQRVRAVVKGEVKRLHVCTTCIKSGKIVKPSPAKASAPTDA